MKTGLAQAPLLAGRGGHGTGKDDENCALPSVHQRCLLPVINTYPL